MRSFSKKSWIWAGLVVCLFAGLGCPSNHTQERTLTLAAYTAPREAFREINEAFEKAWLVKTGEGIKIQASYLSSGAQSRAVRDGLVADVVALALESDIDRLVEAGLVQRDWRQVPHQGILTESIVAFAVRSGNPKKIHSWKDLLQPGLAVLTPNPKTSGGAQWNVLAAYGAVLQGQVSGFPATEESAKEFLSQLLKQVTAMDKGARESILTFERGLGDVALSYENEILAGRRQGQIYELVVPNSTILIQNPIALVNRNVDLHSNRDLAEAYLDFLYSQEAQEIFAKHGFRPVNPEVKKQTQQRFSTVPQLFTVEDLGGWQKVMPKFFGPEGIFVKAMEEVHRK